MDLAKHWRLRDARYRLQGQRNSSDGTIRFPPDNDHQKEWEPYQLSGHGTIYSYTIVRQPPDGYDSQAPYIVAMIKLQEGPMVTAQLTDCAAAELSIDLPVEMVTRKLADLGPDGLLVYGYKFRPLLVG